MTIIADEKYGPKDTDMTAQLTKIKGKAPQAIVNWTSGMDDPCTVKIKYSVSRKYGDWLMREARLIRRLSPRYNRRAI